MWCTRSYTAHRPRAKASEPPGAGRGLTTPLVKQPESPEVPGPFLAGCLRSCDSLCSRGNKDQAANLITLTTMERCYSDV